MKKIKEIFSKDSSSEACEELEQAGSRRDFFKRAGAVSAVAAASIISPAVARASEDDYAIMHHPKWGQSWGDPVTKNLYGVPSAYEHNNIRRYTKLLASGNFRASIALTPIHESEGIITPNGLFFSRCHGGTAHV
ncbi:MAG: sulfite dehydrogenase, partial [Campylobacterota bacterium]|nr:sulfite dehydrogenase [Campylobacterota bacterium]